MYTLTREQKISNYQELLKQKLEKIENLQKEVENIQKKLDKLSKASMQNLDSTEGSSAQDKFLAASKLC